MKLFIDTNVMMDIIAQREPFYQDAVRLFSKVERGEEQAYVASMSYATCAYLLGGYVSKDQIAHSLRKFSLITKIVAVDETAVRKAIAEDSKFTDIEDAMQYHTALQAPCDCIITRNKRDFKNADIPIFTPSEFLDTHQFK